MQDQSTGTAHVQPSLNWMILLPLLVHAGLLQLATQLARVNTTYAAIEVNLSVVWIGVITASYALFPAMAALQIGRFIDRRGDTIALMIGAGLGLAGCIGLWLGPAATANFIVCTTLLGLSQTFCMTSQQSLSARSATSGGRDSAFGYYMLALSLGQAGGALLLGYVAGGDRIPPVRLIFLCTAVICVISIGLAILVYRRAGIGRTTRTEETVPIRDLMRVRGLFAMAIASALVVTALDLSIVYLPLLGVERQIDATMIGYMLALRAAASIFARIVYARLVAAIGRVRLMFIVMLVSMVGLGVIAVPVPVWVLFVASALHGFGLAIAITASLTTLVDIAPDDARGAALSIRQALNRFGQFATPLFVSLIASLTGAAGIFVVTALAVGVSGYAADRAVRQRETK